MPQIFTPDPHLQPKPQNATPGGVAFPQADGNQHLEAVHAQRGLTAEDFLVGNPDQKPFVIVLPILPSMLSVDLQHCMLFTRAPNLQEAVGRAPIIWERFIKPGHFPAQSDFTGQPAVKALDEHDWMEFFVSCLRHHKKDPERNKLIVLGQGTCPHTFCPMWLIEDFKDMRSFEVFNTTGG